MSIISDMLAEQFPNAAFWAEQHHVGEIFGAIAIVVFALWLIGSFGEGIAEMAATRVVEKLKGREEPGAEWSGALVAKIAGEVDRRVERSVTRIVEGAMYDQRGAIDGLLQKAARDIDNETYRSMHLALQMHFDEEERAAWARARAEVAALRAGTPEGANVDGPAPTAL